jgi:hypothetical protein
VNLGLYVWKEWRDQRAGLARLAAVLVLLALCALLLPEPVTGDPLFVSVFACVALAAFALSVGSDLLAGELARDRVRLLERQPGGLAAARGSATACPAASTIHSASASSLTTRSSRRIAT